MTDTLVVNVKMNNVTAKWQDKEVAVELPANFTAEQLMTSVSEVIVDALAGQTPAAIEVVNEIDGLVVLNEASESVTPVMFVDDNDAHFIEALTMNGIGGQLERKNGHALTTGTPVIQVLRLKNNMADVYAHAAMYRTVTAYLRSMLTGQNIVTVEEAKLTGLFDQEINKWDTQGLALTDLTVIQLPEIGNVVAHDLTNNVLVEKMSTLPSVKVR